MSATLEDEIVVQWVVYDQYGAKQIIDVKDYYILTSTMHLFNPQSYFIQEGLGSFHRIKDRTVFTFTYGKHLTLSHTKGSRLHTVYGEADKENTTLMG